MHQAAGGRAVLLDGVQPVKGRIQHLIDDVIAACHQRDGEKREQKRGYQVDAEEVRLHAERDDDARQHKQVLDGMVQTCDLHVCLETFRKRDGGYGYVRHGVSTSFAGCGTWGSP